MPKAKPKCPECKIEGIEHIVSEDSEEQNGAGDPWFQVAYCDECGHVYGVFAKVVNSSTSTSLPPVHRTGNPLYPHRS